MYDVFLKHLLANEADLRALVGCFVRNRQDREDLFQEIALTLWEKTADRPANRPFAPWARGVAMNKVRQYWDRRGRVPSPFSPGALEAIVEAFDRCEEPASAAAQALERCLETLPEKSRRLLAIRYEEALPVSDIAARVGVLSDGVYKALARLRDRVEDCVRRRLLAMEGR